MLEKFIANTALLIASAGLSVLVLIFGWGLYPASWSWVIWGCVGHIVILILSIMVRVPKD